jgi:trehalose 6-phosphate phosphatase
VSVGPRTRTAAAGLGDLDGFRLAGDEALFLDLDGTLAEIGPDPDAIALPEETAAALDRLAVRLGGAVVLLSGRGLADLAARTPASVWRAGHHGLLTAGPGEALPPAPPPPHPAVLAALAPVTERHPATRLELKGPVVALHFRAAPAAEAEAIAAAREAAAAAPGPVHQPGPMVVEVKPAGANKGAALRALAARPPFAGRRPVMFGDDTTDEDAIRAALALGGTGVKVGEGPTAAPLRAPDPAAVRAWLAREAG